MRPSLGMSDLANTTHWIVAVGSALLSSGVTVTAIELFTRSHVAEIENSVKEAHDRSMAVFSSGRAWRTDSVAQLLGPMTIQLDRTSRAFKRYTGKNTFLEAMVLREGNLAIRDLLLSKAHLVPPDLLGDAGCLVEHYDRWLEKFDEVRGEKSPKLSEEFVFVGPDGYAFPREAEARFRERYLALRTELYGVK
jgi:hypothetical protein